MRTITTFSANKQTIRTSAESAELIRPTLLLTAFASSLLYITITIVGAFQWPGYDWISQTISELSAVDAPSRLVVVLLMTVYAVLVLTMGAAVRAAAAHRASRLVGIALTLYGIVCVIGPFAPMHQRAAGATLTDAMHVVLTVVTVVLIITAVGAGAFAFGKRFRSYSFGTVAVFLAFGALAGIQAQDIAANRPTPLAGLFERISVFSFMVWLVVFAIVTVGQKHSAGSAQQ